MHLVNDMLTLLPPPVSNVTSQTTITSPTVNCLPTGQYNALTINGFPAANLGCLQSGLNGYSLGGLQATQLGGYTIGSVPSSCGIAPATFTFNGFNALNGSNGVSVPTSTCSIGGCPSGGTFAGLTTNGLPVAPPTALTAPEVYGLPPPSMTSKKTSTSSESPSSGETSPAPLSPAASMELVWHGEFDRLFAQYFPHIWCLVPTFYPPGDNWRTFKDSAKVRFSCQDCGHGWTSMKGRVVFWFELNYSTSAGCVMFKLYGQQCQRCKTGKFEHAMWYPEEVVKVIGNVYNRVGQIYYGFVRPPLRIDRRVGKPRNQHNAELCQACKEGLCKEEWSFA